MSTESILAIVIVVALIGWAAFAAVVIENRRER